MRDFVSRYSPNPNLNLNPNPNPNPNPDWTSCLGTVSMKKITIDLMSSLNDQIGIFLITW